MSSFNATSFQRKDKHSSAYCELLETGSNDTANFDDLGKLGQTSDDVNKSQIIHHKASNDLIISESSLNGQDKLEIDIER